MGTHANDKRQPAQSPLDQAGAPARGPAARTRAGRPPRGRLRKLGLTGLAAAAMISALALAPSSAHADAISYAANMSPAGTQPQTYSPPPTAPQGIAQFTINPATNTIVTYLQFANVGTAKRVSSTGCAGYLYQASGSELYVIVGGKIYTRLLPPPTCNTISDTWFASSQIVQAIEADPGSAIVYVQAPPGQPGSREYLPGGVMLNPGSIWSQLEVPYDGGSLNA
jgi:hypothetical protein